LKVKDFLVTLHCCADKLKQCSLSTRDICICETPSSHEWIRQ